MRPKTLHIIRRTLEQRQVQVQPTSDSLLRDAERLMLQLFEGDEHFSWQDMRDWLQAYEGYRRNYGETSGECAPLSPDGRYQS